MSIDDVAQAPLLHGGPCHNLYARSADWASECERCGALSVWGQPSHKTGHVALSFTLIPFWPLRPLVGGGGCPQELSNLLPFDDDIA